MLAKVASTLRGERQPTQTVASAAERQPALLIAKLLLRQGYGLTALFGKTISA